MAGQQDSLLICLTGAECTGKTTLARMLADTLDVPVVPEVAREYLAGMSGYGRDDVLAIARAQEAAERAALNDAPLVVADTDLTVIQVWWEEKYGDLDPWIAQALDRRSERRYLVPRPDIPWVPDPMRESPHDRERLHERYLAILRMGGFPYHEVAGHGSTRRDDAMAQVGRWLNEIHEQTHFFGRF